MKTTTSSTALTVARTLTYFLKQQWINPSKTKPRVLYLKTQFVPHSKHFNLRYKKPFILHGAEVAVCFQINKKQTQCGQNVNS